MDADLVLRALARALILPPLSLALLAGVGLWLIGRRPVLGRWLVGAALALLVLLSIPVVADALAAASEPYAPLSPTAVVEGDVIVVLSGGIRRPAPGMPASLYPVTLERLAGGAALARRTGLPMLLSGGTVERGPAEAEVMQATLRADFGLEARFLERVSRTTHENAVETARVLRAAGLRRVVLVTSSSHMRRAVLEFRAAGLEVTAAPVASASARGRDLSDWLPRPVALTTSYEVLYECAGGVVAWLAGRG